MFFLQFFPISGLRPVAGQQDRLLNGTFEGGGVFQHLARACKQPMKQLTETTTSKQHGLNGPFPLLNGPFSDLKSISPELAFMGRFPPGNTEGPEIHGSQGSMEDWDADLSPCNFATAHFPAEISSFISLQHLTDLSLVGYLSVTSRPMNGGRFCKRNAPFPLECLVETQSTPFFQVPPPPLAASYTHRFARSTFQRFSYATFRLRKLSVAVWRGSEGIGVFLLCHVETSGNQWTGAQFGGASLAHARTRKQWTHTHR